VATPEPNRLPESILLIDDDVISREVLATLLEMQGFRVESAEHGAQALDLLQRSTAQPEVILMDAQMPGLSGAELIQALRSACNPAGNPSLGTGYCSNNLRRLSWTQRDSRWALEVELEFAWKEQTA
jgi:CheY-like chemotaxis protein